MTSEGGNVMIRKDTLVVVIHGFTRGAKDMQLWKQELQPEFPDVITPDLPTTYASFEECLEKLTAGIMAAKPENYRQVHFAGHSMGGLLAREFLQRNRLANARRLVCVGTPHYGSKLADIALLLPGAGMIWKPLHALKVSARKNLTTPDIPGLEIGVIVSTNNSHWPGKLFLSRDSDGLVESFSADAPDAADSARCEVNHVGMMFDRKTAGMIKKFLLTGSF